VEEKGKGGLTLSRRQTSYMFTTFVRVRKRKKSTEEPLSFNSRAFLGERALKGKGGGPKLWTSS